MTNIQEDTYRAVESGLEALHRDLKAGKLSVQRRGLPLQKVQLHATAAEIGIIKTLQVAMVLIANYAVTGTVIWRTALVRLARDTKRAMTDKALAAEIAADIEAVRSKRVTK